MFRSTVHRSLSTPRRVTRERRGVTMLVVGLSIVILVGLTAFVLDFGRMYLYRAEVHTSSDAAALAGADQVSKKRNAFAADTAVAYGQLNRVARTTPTIGTGSITPGTWNFGTSTFTPAANWTSPGVNAVSATSRYTASYQFGRIFGFTTRVRSATSVAAIGYIGASECVRPLAMPYRVMLDALYPPAGTKPITYALTAADVEALRNMTTANNLIMQGGNTNTIVNGSYYAVRLPPAEYADGAVGNPWSGGSTYSDALGWSCETLTQALVNQGGRRIVGAGDWLLGEQGNMTGPTSTGTETLCDSFGGGTLPPNPGNNQNFTCIQPVPVKVAIWATSGNAPNYGSCGGKCFLVQYIGNFAITGFRKNEGVTGYFVSLQATGQVTATPSPLTKVVLVQ